MSSIKSLLLWEKWRPKSLEDIILLPRIRKLFEDGIVKGNYIFYGNFGTGKTSLARILVGKYTKDKAYLEINSSLYTSIDVLRGDIEDFCKTTPMMSTKDDMKYIFLDEFERVSPQFQDAFKAFIEKYNSKVRFIITTNHINKIDGGLKSRIPCINFNCQNSEEEKFLKIEFFKKINDIILPSEGKEISKEIIKKIVFKEFPDFRSTMVEIQNHIDSDGSLMGEGKSNISNKTKLDLYNLIYDKADYLTSYNFIMSNFGPDNIDTMLIVLSRSFIDWSISENKNVEKLFECNYVIADYSSKLETSTDPIVLAMTIIGKLQTILN